MIPPPIPVLKVKKIEVPEKPWASNRAEELASLIKKIGAEVKVLRQFLRRDSR